MKTFVSIVKSLTVCALVIALISGCGSNSSEQPPENKEKAQAVEVKTVKLVLPVSTQNDEQFYRTQMDMFMKKNADVKVELLFNPIGQYGNAIQLMFSSNDAPDIYRFDRGAAFLTSLEREWIQPLDSFMTEDFKKRFPEGTFANGNGLTVNGKIYSIPLINPKWGPARPMFYNIDILKQFGYDAPPKTWSELKEMAVKITKQGNGKVFGFAPAGKAPGVTFLALQKTANVSLHVSNNIMVDFKTGKSAAADPGLVAAVELLREMNAAKVFTPGWENWGDPQVHQHLSSGKLAMAIGANWWLEELLKLNPDVKIGVADVPVPDSGRKGYNTFAGFPPYYGMSVNAKHPEAVWKVMDFLGSVEFERAFYEALKIPVLMPKAYEGLNVSENTKKLLDLADKSIRLAPSPELKHPDGRKLWSSIVSNAPKPVPNDLILKSVINNVEYKPMAEDFDAKLNKVIEEKLEDMKKSGSTITIDAFMFKDWDTLQNYKK